MANICSFSMMVVGKKSNRDKFVDALKLKGTEWMGRGADIKISEENDGSCVISGWCKWSVASALINNAESMRKNPDKWILLSDKRSELTFITLPEASKKYNLDVEVFSEEPGCCFSEHYLIKKGTFEIEECVNYYEYCLCDYETKEEAEAEIGFSISDKDWNSKDYITSGGYESWDFSI